jgi:hypothetical protein
LLGNLKDLREKKILKISNEEQIGDHLSDDQNKQGYSKKDSLSLKEIIAIIRRNEKVDVDQRGKNAKADDELLFAVQCLRKMLCREPNPPIDDVINANLVPSLVGYLKLDDYEYYSMLQFESAWALTNIASGTSLQTRKVVEAQAVKPFVNLLASSPNANVQEQSVWALGNIAGRMHHC